MLVDPLADVEVNVPGEMATLIAPVAAQLSMLLAPEFMLVGFAAKEVIVGADPFPEEVLVPQPASPTQIASIKAQKRSREELRPTSNMCAFAKLGVEFGPFDDL
jgi:hypothetical protein